MKKNTNETHKKPAWKLEKCTVDEVWEFKFKTRWAHLTRKYKKTQCDFGNEDDVALI